MSASIFMRAGCFIVSAVLLVFVFGFVFPHNNVYASAALAVYAFIYVCVTRSGVLATWLCGAAYILFSVVDSQFGVHVLTDVKSSESIIFPVVSGFVVVICLFAGLGFKRMFLRHAK